MTFTSVTFLYFLAIVFLTYWTLHPFRRAQNLLLFAASYVFYGWWDWRFLSLLLLSSLIDYVAALMIVRSDHARTRRLYLILSMTSNLGILGFFKYCGFFLENLQVALSQIGIALTPVELGIVLPVGISFYTFQSMSYTIDVYRGDCKPCHSLIDFLAYIAFFPQLVAGPIERASDILPQFEQERTFDYERAVDGLRLMLWGFVRKVIVADNLGLVAQRIYDQSGTATAAELTVATLAFAFQIYCDFAAYSEIARGTAQLFGFTLMRNFNHPYFAVDIRSFWRRWHISLSTWFRDYVYIPLGGNRATFFRRSLNIMAVFLLSGFWHGAEWTFIVWGALHGTYFIVADAFAGLWKRAGQRVTATAHWSTGLGVLTTITSAVLTFSAVNLAWVFFRAKTVSEGCHIVGQILTGQTLADLVTTGQAYAWELSLVAGIMLAEACNQLRWPVIWVPNWPTPLRWCAYAAAVFMIMLLGARNEADFIYFQF